MKNIKIIFGFISLFFIFTPSVLASSIDFNKIFYSVVDDTVFVENIIDFYLEEDIGLEIMLPKSFNNLSITTGGDELNYIFRDGKAVVGLGRNVNEVIVRYSTKDLIKNNVFVSDFENPLFSRFIFIEFLLDDKFVVDTVEPVAKEIIKEDDKIKVKWQIKDVNEKEVIRTLVVFDEKTNLGYFVMPVFAIIVIIYFLISRRKT